MKHRYLAGILISLCVLQSGLPLLASAQEVQLEEGFDPNRILEDDDIFDANAMSYDRMVNFLRAKGTLADYRTPDIDGVPKTAAEIIWRVAMSYKINPKYLLALLQKEQSLVEDPAPTQRQFDWATGYGVCDSCSKDDPSIQNYKGFASQVEWAAKQHREKYLLQILGNGQTRSGNAPGKTILIDNISVTPVNNATAMLYSYTPHIHGNENLWNIWRRWFSLFYPDGTLVQGKDSKKVYLIRLGEKRPFSSPAVMASLVDPNKIITVSDTELTAYPDGAPFKFPKFSLLRDPSNKIWLLTDDGRRPIANMKAFHKFDFNEDEITDVASEDLADYPIGDPITVDTQFPQGVVLRNSVTKELWYAEDGVKHLIPAKVVLQLYFTGRIPKSVSAKYLAKLKTGDVFRLHDGELIRTASDPAVYVLENSALRAIPSAATFEAVGWKWKNVVTVPDSMLSAYTIGDPFSLAPALHPASVQTAAQTSPTTTLSAL